MRGGELCVLLVQHLDSSHWYQLKVYCSTSEMFYVGPTVTIKDKERKGKQTEYTTTENNKFTKVGRDRAGLGGGGGRRERSNRNTNQPESKC